MDPEGDVTVILLAGGTSRRFGGPGDDKLDATLGDLTVFARAVASLPHAWPLVIVGPRRPLPAPFHARAVTWIREDPPFGGPAAGVIAGLGAVTTPWCAVVAGDTPGGGLLVQRLVDAARNERILDGAHPADGVLPLLDGRAQPLLGLYRTDALRQAASALGSSRNMSMRALLEPLDLVEVDAADLGGDPDAARDIDTLADLDARRAQLDLTRPGPDGL